MRKVARRIDYSPTAIYLHFKDRDDLVFCVCEQLMGGLAKELQQVADRHADPLVALKKGLRRYVEFGLKHPQHYQATFGIPHGHDPPRTRGIRSPGRWRCSVRVPAAAGGGVRQAEEAGEGGRRTRELRALGRRPRHHVAADCDAELRLGRVPDKVVDQLVTMLVDGLGVGSGRES